MCAKLLQADTDASLAGIPACEGRAALPAGGVSLSVENNKAERLAAAPVPETNRGSGARREEARPGASEADRAASTSGQKATAPEARDVTAAEQAKGEAHKPEPEEGIKAAAKRVEPGLDSPVARRPQGSLQIAEAPAREASSESRAKARADAEAAARKEAEIKAEVQRRFNEALGIVPPPPRVSLSKEVSTCKELLLTCDLACKPNIPLFGDGLAAARLE